jgi:hypothetical protein
MNALALRRRWLLARPWVMDGLTGLALIGFMVAAFWALGQFASVCQAAGYCA